MALSRFALKPLALAAMLGLAGAANASFITYDSAASFAAVTSGNGTDTYTDLDFGPSSTALARTAGSFTYTATDVADLGTGDTAPFYIADVGGNKSLSTDGTTDTITFTSFNKTVTAIGGNFFGSDTSESFAAGPVMLTIVDAAGSHDFLFANATSSSSFFGIVSTSAITSFNLTSVNGNIFPTVDNLQLAAAVPEPETYALMLGGLGVVAWLRRRQAKSAA